MKHRRIENEIPIEELHTQRSLLNVSTKAEQIRGNVKQAKEGIQKCLEMRKQKINVWEPTAVYCNSKQVSRRGLRCGDRTELLGRGPGCEGGRELLELNCST